MKPIPGTTVGVGGSSGGLTVPPKKPPKQPQQPPTTANPPPEITVFNPPAETVDINAKKVEAMNQVSADYEQFKQNGGTLLFDAYFNQRVNNFLQKHPKAPPNEKGLISEGLGPIGWLLWGWALWSEGIVVGAKHVIGEAIVDKGLDFIVEGKLISIEKAHPSVPVPISPPLDGGVPAGGTNTSGGGAGFGGSGKAGGGSGEAGGEGDMSGGGGCFVKGTVVATPQGLIPIDQMKVSGEVYALDLTTNKLVGQKVMRVIKAQGQEILVLDFGDEKIRCTPLHRFYTGQWIPAHKLQLMSNVLSRDGQWKALRGIGREIQSQPVYNLTVAGIHNYLVGQAGLLVHNVKKTDEESEDLEDL